jgi:hypothetical protein
MITLKQEGINELRKKGMNAANTLESFVSKIETQLYKGESCTIWVEDETVVEMFKSLSEYMIYHNDKLVTFSQMVGVPAMITAAVIFLIEVTEQFSGRRNQFLLKRIIVTERIRIGFLQRHPFL